ncbi:hypothetical protein [Methylobacterium radiotolerans]|uniref:hypothetical protein n=1 Tax=Methylobacterium radiotolerans TaxID=31998 RepID=UPI0011159610|nr:hypothetical protein [Methylobacterium radiotolerans]MBY0251884.1 hypothetical protein [Methylobacterium organophilum]
MFALAVGLSARSRSLTTWLRYVTGMATGMPLGRRQLLFFNQLIKMSFFSKAAVGEARPNADSRTRPAGTVRIPGQAGRR